MSNRVNNQEQIIYVPLTYAERALVIQKANSRGVLNSRTLMDGEGNASGYAGELLVGKYLKGTGTQYAGDTVWDYDFLTPGGLKLDVKTKGNALQPKLDFDCTVPANQANQKCTHYIFVRTAKDLSGGWIKGYITKPEFEELAQTRAEGQAYNNSGRPTRGRHKVIAVNQLYPIQQLLDQLRRNSNKDTSSTSTTSTHHHQ